MTAAALVRLGRFASAGTASVAGELLNGVAVGEERSVWGR